uniref:DDE-1 domain-containing protein n=1 Tax=Daphnia galeata TaxID=27404 RepID=A0A8J2RMN0_9CRUS|nr:unnamed protein product [Daphnia galeata]
MEKVRTTLKEKGYIRNNTFNMDESGLFYRCMPNRTYIVGGGDVRQLGKGTKAMKAKDRVTAVFCSNSTGTCKVPPLIIGTSKQPHCFRDARCPLPYIDQKKAWMDKERYKHWWFNVFLLCICEFTTEKVALLMDSCSGHDKTITDLLDQGIIAVIKTRYKTRMLTQMVNAAENFDELQVEAEKLPNGKQGISYGLPAHVLDATNLLKSCWDELPAETISACWRRSRCLPILDTLLSRSKVLPKPTAKFSLAVGSGSRSLTFLGLSVITNAKTKDQQELLARWLDLENDPEIIATEVFELSNEVELPLTSFNSTACSESFSNDTLTVASLDGVMMDTDAATVPTETNSLADSGIISFPTDQTRNPLSEIEKIDVSRILESAKYIMEIAAESNNPVLIEITRQSFLKIRDDIKSNLSE